MNTFKDISLVIFSTTLGHHGYNDIYKYTLNHIDKTYGFSNFGGLYAAIKVHNNQEDIFTEMTKYFRGFNIVKEIGKKNLDNNPHRGHPTYFDYMVGTYSKSIANLFSWFKFDSEFILWQEDDCITLFPKGVEECIEPAKEILRTGNIFSVNLNGPEYPLNNDDMFGSCNYNFRPHLVRTDKMVKAAEVFKANYEVIKYLHPEMAYETCARHVYKDDSFIQWNAKYAHHRHLGIIDFPSIKQELSLTIE